MRLRHPLKDMQILAITCDSWTRLRRRSGQLALVSLLLLARVADGQVAPGNAPNASGAEASSATREADSSLSYRAYPLQHLDADAARQRLGQILAAAPGLDVVVDGQKNRVLVRGNSQTHQLVAQVLANIDRPPAAESPAPAALVATADAKIAAYPLNDATRGAFTAWQQQLGERPDVRVAIDERTSQVLVYAPPAVHEQVKQRLAQGRVTGATSQQADQETGALPQPPTSAQQPTNGLQGPAGTVLVQLKNLPGAELHQRLERLLSQKLPTSIDASGDWHGFAVEASPGIGVTMSINNRTGQVRIDGPSLQTAAWRSVVEAMDSPPATADAVTQLVATKPASHERVRKALEVLRASSGVNANPNAALTAMLQPAEGAAQPGGEAAPPADGAAQPGTQVVPGNAQTAIDAAQLAEAAGGLLGPVQVEFVEGLDVIVIRGAERDVERVMQIINRIEELSVVTVPSIEIYELKNVDSVQMAALLNQLYTQVLAARIGSVSITALGKPNALLLVGRAENVRMAIDLVKRLDQPVAPFGRFEVFMLQNASATEAKTIIDGFLGQAEGQAAPAPPAGAAAGQATATLQPRALVVADPRTNALIVSASPRDLAEIAALITRIDTPGVSATLKVFTVRNGDAESLANTLRTLFGGATDQAAAQGLPQSGPVRVQFSVDARTNSIIAVGSQDDMVVVEAILTRLDEGELRERINRVYRLRNAYAVDVATALQQMLQTERQAESDAELAISPFEQIEREVVIVPEVASNSLVISATPRYYERIIKLVEDLDERPPMVLIQVLIGEVRLNDTDQFGVELGLQDSLLFDRSLLSDVQFQNVTTTNQVQGTAITTETQNIINANGQPGFNFNNPNLPLGNNLSTSALANSSAVAAQGLSNFAVNRLDPTLGFSGFVFSASSDAVSILLRALQESRRLEVLSRPQLMALDGQPGYVQVGQDVPTIISTTVDPIAGTSNAIQYRSVGLIMEVIPRISPDGLVVMQITATKSEVGPELEGIPIFISPNGQVLRAPRIEITQARTTVSALSGQTVVLGGLIQTRKEDLHRRVPIIADIPLIGSLFRFDSVREERRELLIVMTPQIIYNKLDSDLVKQIESSRMSWCLADTVNIHGEAGLRSRCDEWFDGETEAVYPDYVPRDGELLPLTGAQMGSMHGGCTDGCAIGPVMQMPTFEPVPAGTLTPGAVEVLPAPPSPTPADPTMSVPRESVPSGPMIPPPPTNMPDPQPMSLEIEGSKVGPTAHQEKSAQLDLHSKFNSAPKRLPVAGK